MDTLLENINNHLVIRGILSILELHQWAWVPSKHMGEWIHPVGEWNRLRGGEGNSPAKLLPQIYLFQLSDKNFTESL